METIEIICLANSRKIGGKCVAGLRVDGGGWVRPVSANETGTLLPYQCRLEDGMEARTLDFIKIPILRPLPKSHQPENWLIDENVPWRLVSRPAPRNLIHILRSHLVSGPCLFGNTYDRVPAIYFSSTPASSSLALIVPENLHLYVTTNINNKKQVRAKFSLSGAPYSLVVTDPLWDSLCRVWLPSRDAVVRVRAEQLKPLDSPEAMFGPHHVAYIAAAARVTDAMARNLLLAPVAADVIPLPHQIQALARAVAGDRVRYLLAGW